MTEPRSTKSPLQIIRLTFVMTLVLTVIVMGVFGVLAARLRAQSAKGQTAAAQPPTPQWQGIGFGPQSDNRTWSWQAGIKAALTIATRCPVPPYRA